MHPRSLRVGKDGANSDKRRQEPLRILKSEIICPAETRFEEAKVWVAVGKHVPALLAEGPLHVQNTFAGPGVRDATYFQAGVVPGEASIYLVPDIEFSLAYSPLYMRHDMKEQDWPDQHEAFLYGDRVQDVFYISDTAYHIIRRDTQRRHREAARQRHQMAEPAHFATDEDIIQFCVERPPRRFTESTA